MTDRIQKIREWVKARLDKNASKQSLPQFYGMMEEDARFLDFLDSLQEGPMSKDLEKASKEWLRPQLDKSYEKYGENKMMQLTHFDGYSMLEAIEFGVKWKEKQMMEQAIDGTVRPDDCEVWCNLDSFNFNDGDKVKIVIVKSE